MELNGLLPVGYRRLKTIQRRQKLTRKAEMDSRNQSNGKSAMTKSTPGSSSELLGYLRALELLYRAELAEAEIEMWIHGLSCFPLAEVRAAVDALILNPPEGWTGMPKLPDVIRQIAENREYQAEQSRLAKGAEVLEEMRELEKQKAAGVRFYGLADLAKEPLMAKAVKPMPTVRTVWPDIDPDRNAAKLRQQAEMLKGKQ